MANSELVIIDSHRHAWDPSATRYPWLASVPALDRPFAHDDYARAIAELPADVEVVGGIFVECAAHARDAAAEAMVAAREPTVLGVVAAARPEAHDFAAQLDAVASPKLKGIRRTLHIEPDELSASPDFAARVNALGARGLTYDLIVRDDQMPIGLALARRCPDVQIVLDHCGNPPIKSGRLDAWRGAIDELAALPNVACKVSGLVTHADPSLPLVDQLRPVIEHCRAAFGDDRLLFGSDWPVCTLACSLATWVATLREIVRGWPGDARAKLFERNARRLYHLSPPAASYGR